MDRANNSVFSIHSVLQGFQISFYATLGNELPVVISLNMIDPTKTGVRYLSA